MILPAHIPRPKDQIESESLFGECAFRRGFRVSLIPVFPSCSQFSPVFALEMAHEVL
jgi:hypothetical protein